MKYNVVLDKIDEMIKCVEFINFTRAVFSNLVNCSYQLIQVTNNKHDIPFILS